MEQHLTVCTSCRVRLEELAASQDLWSVVRESLADTSQVELSSEHWQTLRHALDSSIDTSRESLATPTVHADANGSDANVPHANGPEGRLSTQGAANDSPKADPHRLKRVVLRRWLEPSQTDGALGRIGKYDIFDIVGQGGMGLVLKAYDSELKREVAIKTLSQPLTLDEEACLRLEREARAAASVHHIHIVPIYDLEIWCGTPVLVMPLIPGGTLHDYAAAKRLSLEQALSVGVQIADALAALHDQGIVHRDLKPSNILLCDGLEHVALTDFGLARARGDFTVTLTGAMVGTPYFMSPEQVMGSEVDARSDLFSLGCVLFWLITGNHAFVGDHPYLMVQNMVNGSTNLHQLDEVSTPQSVQILIRKLIAHDPSQRWGNARHVHDLLKHCMAACQSDDVVLPSELSGAVNWGKSSGKSQTHSSRKTAAAVGMGLVCILGLTSLFVRAQGWAANRSVHALSPDSRAPGFGALDDLDRLAMLDDLSAQRNLLYWLRRLAALSVDEMPVESLPAIVVLAQHPDPTIRELAQVILNKNPFQEV